MLAWDFQRSRGVSVFPEPGRGRCSITDGNQWGNGSGIGCKVCNVCGASLWQPIEVPCVSMDVASSMGCWGTALARNLGPAAFPEELVALFGKGNMRATDVVGSTSLLRRTVMVVMVMKVVIARVLVVMLVVVVHMVW